MRSAAGHVTTLRPWWTRGLAAAASVALATLAVLGASPITAGASVPAAAPGPATTDPPAFYLDLGASVSVGIQPTAADPHGTRTAQGFADVLVAREAATGHRLVLHELGCPGESTSTMMTGGDGCYAPPRSQLSAALSFLRANSARHGLVTVDIGYNDLVPCLAHRAVDPRCIDQQLGRVGDQLATILAALRRAAGPQVRIIGVGAYDPFLATAFDHPSARAYAAATSAAMDRLNAVLLRVYRANGMPMADVAATFAIGNAARTSLADDRGVPVDVARACQFTWMCAPPPLGPNIHPNDVGYAAIAGAIAAKIPAGW